MSPAINLVIFRSLLSNRTSALSTLRLFSQAVESRRPDVARKTDYYNVSSIRLPQLQRMISERKYILNDDKRKDQFRYLPEFFDFLISWCRAKAKEVEDGSLDSIVASHFAADVLHSMHRTLKELKKRKPPRSGFLEEISRLYLHGLRKLSDNERLVTASPAKTNRILCQYANACCNFDFDPDSSSQDLWPSWFKVAKIYLENIDTDVNEESKRELKSSDFSQAYAYLLSLIIDVTLRFGRIDDFKDVKSVWESRIAEFLSTFKQRNRYILSLRMATIVRRQGIEFEHVVARNLVEAGFRRSLAEFKYRTGAGEKPNRSGDDGFEGTSE